MIDRKSSTRDRSNFIPHGPFKVPLIKGAGGRAIDPLRYKHFWSEHDALANKRGTYVFAIRASKGFTPYYAGKATKTFEQEVFSDRNVAQKYDPVIAGVGKGTPVVFLLELPIQRGKTNKRAIKKCEDFLIQQTRVVNPKSTNIQGTKPPKWSIWGVLRGPAGKPPRAALSLRKCLGLQR